MDDQTSRDSIDPRRLQKLATASDAPDAIPRLSDSTDIPRGRDRLTRDQVWVVVAGVLIGCAGSVNFIVGIAAVLGSNVLPTGADYLLTHDAHAADWTVIVLGVLQCIASLLIWTGARLGRWFGVCVSVVGIAGSLGMISAHPVWSAIMGVVNVVIIYGLVEHGSRGSLVE
jgi:hypothetical protein